MPVWARWFEAAAKITSPTGIGKTTKTIDIKMGASAEASALHRTRPLRPSKAA